VLHTLSFMWIDAFTRTRLAGNPCMVIFGADDLSADQMQTIAREVNLSETAFLLSSTVAQFRARYFTPAEEIPLAGHPTISITRALLDSGALKASDGKFSLQFEAGVIEVELEPRDGDTLIRMSQKKPVFMDTYSPEYISPVFGLYPEDFLPDVPIQTVSTGTPQLMMAVRDLDVLRRIQVNIPLYQQLRDSGDFFSPHLFCMESVAPGGDTFARHFGLPPDTYEDPFTGSATGGMSAYLWRYGLIDSPTLTVDQGHWMGRPGRGFVEVLGAPEDIQTVKVAGYAVRLMQGEITI